MEQWRGKVAIVTGASAGIGYDLSRRLCELGMNVVGCARNTGKIEVSLYIYFLLHGKEELGTTLSMAMEGQPCTSCNIQNAFVTSPKDPPPSL